MAPTVSVSCRNALFLGLVLVMALSFHVVEGGAMRSLSKEEEDLELEAQLKILNKPPVETIHTEWGDILDCIDIHKQPAFDHPLLKNHKIQMKPTSIPERRVGDGGSSSKMKNKRTFSSLMTPGKGCPEGTVPIRRTTKEDLIRAKSVTLLPIRSSSIAAGGSNNINAPVDVYLSTGLLYNPGEQFYGISGDISIHNPVVRNDQFSSVMMSLEAGPIPVFNGIHFGWSVNPQLYGDNLTRTFIYSTGNGTEHGCYNIQCSSFVQVHDTIIPGNPLHDISTYNGTQHVFKAMVFKDINGTNDWWLKYGENLEINVGYWPNSVFPLFSGGGGATFIYWGGQVLAGKDRFGPEMGNGHLPDYDFKRAGYIENMQVVTASFIREDPNQDNMNLALGCSQYYGIQYLGYQKDQGHCCLFGGPGGKCF